MLSDVLHFLMLSKVRQRRGTLDFANKMVITGDNEEDKANQEKESKEESILAMLGIIGTILNLLVIIFVYIYTTL
ncbi:protein TUNAR [Discoglossus pictus]